MQLLLRYYVRKKSVVFGTTWDSTVCTDTQRIQRFQHKRQEACIIKKIKKEKEEKGMKSNIKK